MQLTLNNSGKINMYYTHIMCVYIHRIKRKCGKKVKISTSGQSYWYYSCNFSVISNYFKIKILINEIFPIPQLLSQIFKIVKSHMQVVKRTKMRKF